MRQFTLLILLGFLLTPVTAHASLITLEFTGTINLSPVFGGPAASVFSGSTTWDSDALPRRHEPGVWAGYRPASTHFTLNGVDLHDAISASLLNVYHSSTIFESYYGFLPNLTLGNGIARLTHIEIWLIGPGGILVAEQLPHDLSFLDAVTSAVPVFYGCYTVGGPNCRVEVPGEVTSLSVSISPTAVPEPATGLLLAVGIGGLAMRRRLRRLRKSVNRI